MLNTNQSKTLEHLQANCSLTEIEENPVNSGLFCQIYNWLQQKPEKMKQYRSHSKVAERRDELNLNLFNKKNKNSKNSLKVLKTFPFTLSSGFIPCFVRDAVIPLLINDPSVLKCGEIFLFEEVKFMKFELRQSQILNPKLKIRLIQRPSMLSIPFSRGQI